MANIALAVANKVDVVESVIQMTLPAAEAIVAGAPVRIDTSTGRFTNSNGTTTAEARVYGIATKTVAAGMPVTAVRKGVIGGYDFAALAYDLPIYVSDTDGRLEDSTAPTVDVIVGRIIPGAATTLGTAYDKLLFVDL